MDRYLAMIFVLSSLYFETACLDVPIKTFFNQSIHHRFPLRARKLVFRVGRQIKETRAFLKVRGAGKIRN